MGEWAWVATWLGHLVGGRCGGGGGWGMVGVVWEIGLFCGVIVGWVGPGF